MSLDVQAGIVGTAIVHEPNGHGQGCQQFSDPNWDDLAPTGVEAGVPLGEHLGRARNKLHARVPTVSKLLVELVKRHRDKAFERRPLELGQRPLSYLVLDEEPVEPAVLRQTPIAQQRPNEDFLLPTC